MPWLIRNKCCLGLDIYFTHHCYRAGVCLCHGSTVYARSHNWTVLDIRRNRILYCYNNTTYIDRISLPLLWFFHWSHLCCMLRYPFHLDYYIWTYTRLPPSWLREGNRNWGQDKWCRTTRADQQLMVVQYINFAWTEQLFCTGCNSVYLSSPIATNLRFTAVLFSGYTHTIGE